MTTTQRERIARVHEILAAHGRLRAVAIADLAGWGSTPTWELEQLVALGMVVKLRAAPGGPVDATWSTVRQAKAAGWK